MTNFSGLSIALAGLRSARRQMDVAAQNVSNAQNPDYARRRLVSGSAPPTIGGLPMAGPDGLFTQRITDEFYERRALTESATAQHLTTLASLLGGIEQAVPEPSGAGVPAALSSFFTGLNEVAGDPSNVPVREAAIARAVDLTQAFNQIDDSLTRVRSDVVSKLQTLASDVNSLADRLAQLNQGILNTNAAGGDPGDAIDQRDAIARQLAEKIGARFEPGANGTINVFVGGGNLVTGNQANHLRATDDGTTAGLAWDGPAFTGPVSGIISGDAAAFLEMANSRIASTRTRLDAAASALVTQVNALHQAGFGLDGSTGRPLFLGVTAGDLTVNPDLTADASRLAAGSTASPMDSSIATRLADLAAAVNGPLGEFQRFVAGIGGEVRGSQQLAEVQVGVLGQIDAARFSARGVSVDEEVASLVGFQRSYEASSKVIQVFNTTMDALMSIVR